MQSEKGFKAGTISAALSMGQKLKKKRQEPVPEPEAKPRRLRVKKPGEAGAAEDPGAPAQGKHRHPPTTCMEMGGHAGPSHGPILHLLCLH